jgi:hypothetical protein
MNSTLLQAKQYGIGKVLQVGECTAEFLRILNEAQQILVQGPEKWWGLVYWYSVSITDGHITWPREIATIEGISACGVPLDIRSQWFQFVKSAYCYNNTNGYGLGTCSDYTIGFTRWQCNRQMFDQGDTPLFKQIVTTGNPQNIWIQTTSAESAGQYFRIYGFDWNGNRLFTNTGAGSSDGIQVALPTTLGATAVFPTSVSKIIAIDKPVTNGTVNLLSVDTVTAAQVTIGQYQWDETSPQYRRSFIGGICPLQLPAGQTIPIRVLAKREFIPARNDTDILMISNLPALKRMMISINARDRGTFQQAEAEEKQALDILEREANHYLGSAQQAPLQIFSDTWGTGDIPALR